MHRWILVLVLLTLLVLPADAAVYVVNPYGTGDFPNIQAAVVGATDGDVIELTNGTFSGDGNRDVDFLGKVLTIRSASGDPTSCVIDCEGEESNFHRGFHFHSGEGQASVLADVQVQNGWAISGGGALCENGSSPTLSNLIFDHDRANHEGGGLCCYTGAAPLVSGCVFTYCSGSYGGGVAGDEASPTFTGCDFIRNDTDGPGLLKGGGGIYAKNCTLIVRDCFFSWNFGEDYAGGLSCSGATATLELTGSHFYDNGTDGAGGAASFACTGGQEISNCTFADNSAFHPAGGFAIRGPAQVTYCTVTTNFTYMEAGGVGVSEGDVSFENTIIWDNAAEYSAPEMMISPGASVSLTCCDVDSAGIVNSGNLSWGEGNVFLDPRFCGDENPEDPYTLHALSPCAPDANPECGLIGAWPVGCGGQGVDVPLGIVDVRLHAHPNPTPGEIELGFQVPAPNPLVDLAIYDATGRRVRRLANGRRAAGIHCISWDGTDDRGQRVPAGAYFGRITIGDQSAAHRLLVVR